MKIYCDNYIGHVTLQRMLPYWKAWGHDVSDSPKGCNIHLANVRIGSKTNLPVILRLDSIYYDSATNYNARNIEISNSHCIADGIIYQSNYSKMLIERLLRPRKPDTKISVIANGIDPEWIGEPIEHSGINITITGKHRRHKRLKEIIELFLDYNKLYPDSKLHIFGMLYDNVKLIHKNIVYYGQVPRSAMMDVFRITDFSIHLSKRDSFPNSVVEYIGAGIPVITTNNCGGATEACGMTQGCIIVDGDGNYEDTNPVPHYSEKWNVLPIDVYNNLIQAMIEITEHRRRVCLPLDLTAEVQAHKYLKLMDSVLRKV